MKFSHNKLICWYNTHKRDLPWRQTSDPYAIWVSEVMLQQTQVKTVIPYYLRWMERFPDFKSLAMAEEEEILSYWQGLGYYRRCSFLQRGVKYVLASGLPLSAKEWEKVPGVGRYTAGAIASIAQNLPAALVDGNVERVFARLTGFERSKPDLTQASWVWAEANLAVASPGTWNQALMELGAMICTPKNPNCDACPLQNDCVAYREKTHHLLPAMAKKMETVALRWEVWVPLWSGKFGLRQIPKGRWWSSMWEFPYVDCKKSDPEKELRQIVGLGLQRSLGKVSHCVTHHRIQAFCSVIDCESASDQLKWFSYKDLECLPLSSLQRKILTFAEKTFCF